MALPQHIEQVPEQREAYAPYNFVPLPEKVVPAEEVALEERVPPIKKPDGTMQEFPHLVRQDIYHAGRYTGRIECTLTTESPLYVRCGLTPEQLRVGKEAKDLPDFFYTESPDQPVIPGSSLRGMLRALVEIATYGKMEKVTDKKLFYRSLNDREYYTNNFVRLYGYVGTAPNRIKCYHSLVRAGFLHKRNNTHVIEECRYGRIERYEAHPQRSNHAIIPPIPSQIQVSGQPAQNEPLYIGNYANQVPNWIYQNKRTYVRIDSQEQNYPFPANPRHPALYLRYRAITFADFNPAPNTLPGRLMLTGHMQHKHLEFIFLEENNAEYEVPSQLIERFHDDDQITKWQEDAFPEDQPSPQRRPKDGWLRDGEPVFFLLDDQQKVRFLGRAQMFRLPYAFSPRDFVTDYHENLKIVDLADALFGYVRGSDLCAGRVFVSDATLKPAREDVWLREDKQPITPRILGGPKPTTFQHYLVQQSAVRRELKHYASKPEKETIIRGHKLYWHKGPAPSIEMTAMERDEASDTQTTKFKPVKPGVSFKFDIRFENLSRVELGALLWVLRLADDKNYRLKLGMGKSLGMGAVKIAFNASVCERRARYTSLFAGGNWATGNKPPLTSKECDGYIGAFESYILDNLFEGDKEERKKIFTLDQLARIQCLLLLLAWPGPDRSHTRYMEIERDAQHPEGNRPGRERSGKVNEYSERLVLPTPLQVYPEHERLKGDVALSLETVEHTPIPAKSDMQTMRARVGGVGAHDASVIPVDGGKPGRARFAPDLSHKPHSGDLVLVQLNGEGKPEIIIAFL